MKRTLYNDGVEVDQADLQNTESTKIDEILSSRKARSRFGVISGLPLAVTGNNTVSVGVGSLSFFNGEIGVVSVPLTGIVGASFDAGKSSFFGLRLTEVTSNPKPHETDPTTFDSRVDPLLEGEFFVATTATDDARQTALTNAINAQTVDGNFVLLGEMIGTGTGFTLVRNTPLPITKGGEQPQAAGADAKSVEAKARTQSLYSDASNNEFPIDSATDDFHRSLIGTGIPSASNPHGLTINDIGGDKNLQEHESNEHSNGLIGLEPSDDDFTPVSGSFAFATADAPSNTVTVQGISTTESLTIRGNNFANGAIGVTTIPFTGLSAGLYYIAAKFGSDSDDLTVDAYAKTTFDALCSQNNGVAVWVNNAQELSAVSGLLEKKYFVIGLVFWNGSNAFRQLSDAGTITIPASGSLVYRTTAIETTNPFFIPAAKKTLDLRRWGTITNENVQKYTVNLDRIVPLVTPFTVFRTHAGLDINGTAIPGMGQKASSAAGGAGNKVVLKHLTDFDAWDLFGHRGRRGSTEHAAAINDESSLAPPTDKPQNYGFQTNADKWRQDNLTMTIFKWSDVATLDGTNKSIADASATGAANDTGVQYPLVRTGFFTNIYARLGNNKDGAGNLQVIFMFDGLDVVSIATFTSGDADGAIKGVPGPFFFGANPAAPHTVGVRRVDTGAGGKNLTVTAEFHFVS